MTRRTLSPTTAAEPVVKIDAAGAKRGKFGGKLHREDGPAIEYANGSKHWYHHGQLHRDDGPAIEWFDGDKEWWLNGRRYTKSEWLREVLKDHPLTSFQRELLDALSENWEGTPDALYEVVLQLSNPVHVPRQTRQ